jgi:hypothetical protein
MCKEMPVIPVNKAVDQKRIIGKMEGQGGGGLPDFSWYNLPTRRKMYQLPQNIPNGHKLYKMSIKWTKCP